MPPGSPGKTTGTGKTLADFNSDYSDYYVAYEIQETATTPLETFPKQTWLSEALSQYPD